MISPSPILISAENYAKTERWINKKGRYRLKIQPKVITNQLNCLE